MMIKKKAAISDYVSTQQMVDCARNGSNGCRGGWMHHAYSYLASAGGAEPERAYPYEERDNGGCRFDRNKVFVRVTGSEGCDPGMFTYNNQCSIQKWLGYLQQGPVAVIVASREAFQNYNGGVIDPNYLYCQQYDHAVVAVGWRLDANTNRNIITVRNSWGANWGNQGHFQIFYSEANRANGSCWITSLATVPLFQ